MKITQMTNVNWTQSPKIKATCTVDVDGFGIKECKVIDGAHGIFVVSPSKTLKKPYVNKKGKEVKYEDIVYFPEKHRDKLNDLVTNHYDSSQPDYTPYDSNGNIVSFDQAPKETATSDEDIPF
tara:strand:- start:1163 stop:1531 length:369 start_codon:yes stop_codon:yes gene_type:complete